MIRRFLYQSTLQRRLSLLTAMAVAMSMLVMGVAAYIFTRVSLYDQLDRELVEAARATSPNVSNDLENMGGLYTEALRAANVTMAVVRADNTWRLVRGEKVQLNLTADELAVAKLQDGWSHRTGTGNIIDAAGRTVDVRQFRIVAVPLQSATAQLDGYYALVIARPLDPTQRILDQLALLLVVFGAFMAFLSGVVGAAVARSGLAPVRKLSGAVARVTETNELEPIEAKGQDELADLARSFNTMLVSLATSRERQRRLIADAGHELRTPLTSLRTNIELLVADDRTHMLPEGARGEILSDVASQLSEFSSLIGDLVQLSRDEQVQAAPEPVDMADVVTNAVARARRRGPGLTFDVVTEPHLLIGEPDQLERAITNLLDNAVKFSPPGGTVGVHMRDGRIEVSDEGPGIAEEDLPKIFDRFYRSDKARNTPGTGLGLSIVSHTIESHGGTVTAGNAPAGGAMFTVTLPVQDAGGSSGPVVLPPSAG